MKKLSTYVSIIALAILSFSSCTPESNPVACMQVSDNSVQVDTIVYFNSCSTDADELIWNLGDGTNNMIGSSISHAYADTGTYIVTLTAINGNNSNTITDTIHVTAPTLNGTYNASDVCTPQSFFNYTMTINQSNNTVTIDNLGNLNVSVMGTVNGSAINIPSQPIDNIGTNIYSLGSMSNDTITFAYVISNGSTITNCTSIAIKQ